MRTPIAWEITKGSKDIVHIIGYDFSAPYDFICSDVEIKETPYENGNWLHSQDFWNGIYNSEVKQ